jgi:uncharacterized protein YfiM (DUF2279 family)
MISSLARRSLVCKLAYIFTLCLPIAAQARCLTNDKWTGEDKAFHEVGGAFIAAGVTAATNKPMWGFLAASAVGVLKEAWDEHHPGHTCSLQDAAVTIAGGAVGAAFTGWALRLERQRVEITYSIALP